MKQVTFEMLRHGPPNNQLLSPLTDYMALCQNHPPCTLRVPFEHNQFMHRLRALSYSFDEGYRAFQLRDTAKVLADIMGTVPGLVAELNRDLDREEGASDIQQSRQANRTTHLRMILSSSELALLPFELMLSPPGFPGAGQPLLLQFQDPICMTREVRRVTERALSWPAHPKVLFVAASPGVRSATGPGSIPFDAHLAAMTDLLEPWADDSAGPGQRLKDQLVVLRNASCEQIAKTCAEHDFSHVHILAHGVKYEEGFDVRFGIALHDPDNPDGPADPVSGDRLATALRPVRATGERKLQRPLAVTIASCDSGGQGGVLELGGSVTFALHQAEIPLVVGSQFPLSKEASVDFVTVLYETLLWGRDPRLALNDLRRRLHTQYPKRHDWASVMAYMALPNNFGSWLADAERRQCVRSMETAIRYSDLVTERVWRTDPEPAPMPPVDHDGKVQLLQTATRRMDEGEQRLLELYERGNGDRARVAGKLAATQKRCAQIYYYFSIIDKTKADEYGRRWPPLLRAAHQHYWDVFELEPDQAWAIVQYLSLDLVLRRLMNPIAGIVPERHLDHNNPQALWNLAHTLSLNDLRTARGERRAWAFGNLIELCVIGLLLMPSPTTLTGKELSDRALRRAEDLVDHVGSSSFHLYSIRRQIQRYLDWFPHIADIGVVGELVGKIIAVLPECASQPDE